MGRVWGVVAGAVTNGRLKVLLLGSQKDSARRLKESAMRLKDIGLAKSHVPDPSRQRLQNTQNDRSLQKKNWVGADSNRDFKVLTTSGGH